jgi:N-methylhydantoinase A/oxoprolinase/acetone carboxylase beta subunit
MTSDHSLRMGVHVGSTNADAVLVDAAGSVLAQVTVEASADLGESVEWAVAELLAEAAVDPGAVSTVSLGADPLADAITSGTGLHQVAVLRIGAPLTTAVPPLVTWPPALRAAVDAGTAIVSGGCEFDGTRIAPLDERAVATFAATAGGRAQAVAITSVFSPVDPRDELRAAAIVAAELGDIPISTSHEIGSMGLLERENATVLNAALSGSLATATDALRDAVLRHGMTAECYLVQNDGTQRSLAYSFRFPVLLIGSGPANSMRGAAHASGLTDAVVVDVAVSRTTVGRLVNGFPGESLVPYTVGGVATNLRLPDLIDVPIGGGVVREALCCGGTTPTLTDAAVADGRMHFGDVSVPDRNLPELAAMLVEADHMLAEAVDRIGLGAQGLPVLVVGEGGGIAPRSFPGVAEVIRPPHGEVANALGAAIAPVGGTAERICAGRPDLLRAAVLALTAEAVDRAVQAGASPEHVQVVGIEESPLAYLRDPAVRIRVRAVGPPLTPPLSKTYEHSTHHPEGRHR